MSFVRSASWGAVTLMGAALLSGPALASDPTPPRVCTSSGNVGVTSDYYFRGISQNLHEPALQAGIDLTCGKFYVGIWGSNVAGLTQAVPFGTVEFDIYAGYRFSTGKINWDLGLVYYIYPGPFNKVDSIEWKAAVSTQIWKGGSIGFTTFQNFEDEVGIYEGVFSQVLPKVGMFTPTFSATYGEVHFGGGGGQYSYWNAGVTLSFLEKWSLDLRYWDNDLGPGFVPFTGINVQDAEFVATLKYSF